MKTVLEILSIASMVLSACEIFEGRIDGAILFIIWSFYLKYLSDQNK